MKKSLFLLFFMSICVFSQEYKFGDVSIAELEEKQDAHFPEANAKIIIRDVENNFGEVLYVFERIKIYNKEGFEYAKWEIYFDDVEALKATTYNLVNGEVVATKAKKESIFKEEISEGEEVSKISFPDVKEGSVLEIKYKVRGLGLRYINTQSYIPMKNVRVLIKNPYSRELRITQNPLSSVTLKTIDKPFEISYTGENIEPFKKEEYVPSYGTYMGRIYIEQIGYYGKNKMRNWGEIAELFNDVHWFGAEVRRSGYFKKDLKPFLEGELTPLERATNIYHFLQNRMTWDGGYTKIADETRTAYSAEKGNIAQINITLTAMLREAGLNANPMLAATKKQGYILFPTAVGFDSVLTALEIDDEIYILDASKKHSGFGELPTQLINGKGLIVYDDDTFKTIPTSPSKISKSFVIANASFDVASGSLIGDFKQRVDGYIANRYRKEYANKQKNAYWNWLQEDNNLLYISEGNVKDVMDVRKPITLEAQFKQEGYIEEIGGNLYFDPLFIFGLKENVLSDEERVYPVDFIYPYSKTFKLTFEIPDGYQVESLPEGVNVSMQDAISAIKYENIVTGNKILISLNLDVNFPLIPADYYEGIKTIFTEYYKISNSKIVLKKI